MIRLVTVIGHGTNLLRHFIHHYQQQVDEINIVVYETDMFPLLGNEVKEIIVFCLPRRFCVVRRHGAGRHTSDHNTFSATDDQF